MYIIYIKSQENYTYKYTAENTVMQKYNILLEMNL